jgi:hypothetical protein
MNAYSRSLPHLGFDPAPGDVDATRALAKRHHDVAGELRSVVSLLECTDLQDWEGKAADATRARLIGDILPALRKSLAAADRLSRATGRWAGRLQEFQSEADSLEKKAARAAEEQAAHPAAHRAAGAEGRAASDPATYSTMSSGAGPADDLHERYLAESRRTAKDAEEDGGVMEKIEPYRKILEAVLAPLDVVAADHWIGALEKLAGVPSERLEALDEAIEAAETAQQGGTLTAEQLIALGNKTEDAGRTIDAFDAFAPTWLRTAAGSVAEIRGLGTTLSVLGVVADGATVVDPPDKGAMGYVDRGAAGLNGGLIVANMAMDEIPVAGEVVMIGTGVYLAGDFLYHNWTPFRDVCNDVGHASVTAVESTGHAVGSAWHSVSSTVGSWFSS